MNLQSVPLTPVSVAVGAMIVAFATKTGKGMCVLEEAIRLARDEHARKAVVHLRQPRHPKEAVKALDDGVEWLLLLQAFARAKTL